MILKGRGVSFDGFMFIVSCIIILVNYLLPSLSISYKIVLSQIPITWNEKPKLPAAKTFRKTEIGALTKQKKCYEFGKYVFHWEVRIYLVFQAGTDLSLITP